MTEAASLFVTVGGRDVGAEALINRVRAAGRQADADLTRSGASIGTNFSAGVGRATSSALAFQQAQARLEAQSGNLVGAANRLRNALAQVDTTTTQTIGAQRQLLSVQQQQVVIAARVAQAQARVDAAYAKTTTTLAQHTAAIQRTSQASLPAIKSTSALGEMGQAFSSSMLGIVGPVAIAGAAIGTATTVVNSFVEAFQFKAQLDATTASINAQLKGMRDTGQVFQEASAFAREFKLTQEETTNAISASIGVMRASKAPVEDILGVLARMQILSPEQSLEEAAVALKALASGDTTSLVTRFEVGRDVANQMKAEIQGGADAVAVMSKFLGDTGIGMDVLATRATGAAGALKDAAIAAEELKLAQAAFAEGPGLAILETKILAIRGATRLLSGDFDAMGQSIVNAATNTGSAITNLGNDMQGGAGQSGLWAAEAAKVTPSMYDMVEGAVAAGTAIREQAAATAIAAGESQLDAAAKAAEAAETALLAAQNQRLVDTFLALNPNISASGAAATAAAAGYPPLIQQLIEAAVRARQARGELAAFNALANVKVGTAVQRADDREFDTAADRAKVKSNQALAANRALLSKINADEAKATRAGAAAGRSAGATKLSDQAKLNNSLLANQEKYQDQALQAATDHEQKLIDIERDFQERSQQQQSQNEVGKRSSRASFYRTLLLDTEGLSPQIEGSLKAGYEAAFARSQELAQSGNAKLAADYLALKQEQLSAEAQYQADLAKAREEGDKDLIARLEAVHALEAQAAAERESQLLAGGDADVAARDKALTAEEQRYAEQAGKIGTSAEQAADRKVLASERAGKAIDAENVKLQQQEALLNRIGGGGAAPAGGRAELPPPPATTPTSAPADANAGILGLLESLINAVREAQAGIVRSQGETTGAVRGLGGRLSGA